MRKIIIGFSALLFISIAIPTQAQYIQDLSPVDVYGNLENKGFSVEKDLGSDWGNFWTCTLQSSGLNYKVDVSSDDVNRIQSIDATVRNANRNTGEVKQFFKYLASVLFLNGANGKAELEQWIDNNFNNDGSVTSVGDTEIKISAPTQVLRKIRIDSDLSDGI